MSAASVVRPVVEADLTAVVAMVHELAEYERTSAECHLTVDALREALLTERPTLYGHVARVDDELVGIALWYRNFDTWNGVPFIYLEDLYVRPQHRSAGHGVALLAELAAECVRRGYSKLKWQVLDWNSPSLDFYRGLGAHAASEWLNYGLSGDALTQLAARRR